MEHIQKAVEKAKREQVDLKSTNHDEIVCNEKDRTSLFSKREKQSHQNEVFTYNQTKVIEIKIEKAMRPMLYVVCSFIVINSSNREIKRVRLD